MHLAFYFALVAAAASAAFAVVLHAPLKGGRFTSNSFKDRSSTIAKSRSGTIAKKWDGAEFPEHAQNVGSAVLALSSNGCRDNLQFHFIAIAAVCDAFAVVARSLPIRIQVAEVFCCAATATPVLASYVSRLLRDGQPYGCRGCAIIAGRSVHLLCKPHAIHQRSPPSLRRTCSPL